MYRVLANQPQVHAAGDVVYVASGVALASVTAHTATLSSAHVVAGLALPMWVGWLVFFGALLYGSAISIHQETVVDKYIKRPKLKPFYSFGFGFFVSLFGIPLKYQVSSIWELIFPALILAAIGSQVIYYIVAFTSSPELWQVLKERFTLFLRGSAWQQQPDKHEPTISNIQNEVADKPDATEGGQ